MSEANLIISHDELLLAALRNDGVAIDQLIEKSNIFIKEWKENESKT